MYDSNTGLIWYEPDQQPKDLPAKVDNCPFSIEVTQGMDFREAWMTNFDATDTTGIQVPYYMEYEDGQPYNYHATTKLSMGDREPARS